MHVRRTSFLWDRTCFMPHQRRQPRPERRWRCRSTLSFDADFRDVFEVRGAHRAARGRLLPTRETDDGLVFEYHGLDGVTRQTVVQIEPAPHRGAGRSAAWS